MCGRRRFFPTHFCLKSFKTYENTDFDVKNSRMLSYFVSLERHPGEPLDSYCRRRLRAASQLAHREGDWGTMHARRLCEWAAHLERPRNSNSLAAILYHWHDASWLAARRRDPCTGGNMRPGTRSSFGLVHARWDESLALAQIIY